MWQRAHAYELYFGRCSKEEMYPRGLCRFCPWIFKNDNILWLHQLIDSGSLEWELLTANLLTHSPALSLTFSLAFSLSQTLSHMLIRSLTHFLTRSFTRSLSHSFALSLIRSLTFLLSFSVTFSHDLSLTFSFSLSLTFKTRSHTNVSLAEPSFHLVPLP